MRFLTRRALNACFLLFSVSVLSLALLKVTPGDYFDSARLDPRISSDAIAAMRSEQGLDKPFPILYGKWLHSVAKGDWGFSFAYNSPAGPIVWSRARNTLVLASCATLFAWLIAIPAGITAAAFPGGWAHLITNIGTALLLGIPEIVLALCVFIVASRSSLHLLGTETTAGSGYSIPRVLIAASCLAAGLLPLLVSHTASSVTEVFRAPFVSSARSFGISPVRILLRWVLPAALNPIISLFGLSIGLLVSSSLIVESVFGWPGLGQLMLQAVNDRDVFLIVDSAIMAAAFLILGNLAADVLLYLSDPRIRVE